ncbi:kinase-like domain-containing protein [Entophlyctis helioformis]|nr:kinase-like domain-containing protein [Entophlyctis helioformis]
MFAQLRHAIVGASLSAQFDVQEELGTAGVGRLWQVRKATAKNTGKPCAIFIFENSSIEKRNPLARQTQTKADVAFVSDRLKREVQMITKLRHPSVIQVQESLQDLRTALVFATEPVLTTLAASIALGNSTAEAYGSTQQPVHELDSLEIQKGLSQITKGIQFLHSANIVHLYLNPESIIINVKGDWKLAGFLFATTMSGTPGQPFDLPPDYSNPAHVPACCSPDLGFVAPEVIMHNKASTASDVWSLGALIFSIFNQGKSVFDCGGSQFRYKDIVNGRMIDAFALPNIPPELEGIVSRMLLVDPTTRAALPDFLSSKYFEDVLMTALVFIESLIEKPELEKAKFLKALPALLPRFPEKLVMRKILTLLLDELKSVAVAPFVLPSLFWILDKGKTNEQFGQVAVALRPLLQVLDPPQSAQLLLSRMDLLAQKLSADVVKTDLVPFVLRCISGRNPTLQDAGINAVAHLVNRIDAMTIKTTVLPKLEAVFQASTVPALKVHSLLAMHSIVKVLDKFDIVDRILPLLERSATPDVGVTMTLLAVYESVSTKIDARSIATFVIPSLWKNSMQAGLDAQQFLRFTALIESLSLRVKQEHLKALGQQNSQAGGLEASFWCSICS